MNDHLWLSLGNPAVGSESFSRSFIVPYSLQMIMQVMSIEEHVRASAEYKLGVANQSITAGFFDDNTRLVDLLQLF